LKIGIVIPARLNSERLPNKVLKSFLGKPMIEHIWKRANLVKPKTEIVIATDSFEIKLQCESFGAKVIMTSNNHSNGLSRVGEVAKILNWDFYIILQADEILIDPKNLEKLIQSIEKNKLIPFYNLITSLSNNSELYDKNLVKCLINMNNLLIYLFRISGSVAPESTQLSFTKKICGVFAISDDCLKTIASTVSQRLEISESIEQLKLIEMGYEILGVEIDNSYPSVNTEADATEVLKILEQDLYQREILNQTL
jgi:3-deoxy-manno-octulosonate cytidylyltransferase (CMP-KDO synthetase)